MRESRINQLLEEIIGEIKKAEVKNRKLYDSALDIDDEELSMRTQAEAFKILRRMKGLKNAVALFKSELEKSGLLISGDSSETAYEVSGEASDNADNEQITSFADRFAGLSDVLEDDTAEDASEDGEDYSVNDYREYNPGVKLPEDIAAVERELTAPMGAASEPFDYSAFSSDEDETAENSEISESGESSGGYIPEEDGFSLDALDGVIGRLGAAVDEINSGAIIKEEKPAKKEVVPEDDFIALSGSFAVEEDEEEASVNSSSGVSSNVSSIAKDDDWGESYVSDEVFAEEGDDASEEEDVIAELAFAYDDASPDNEIAIDGKSLSSPEAALTEDEVVSPDLFAIEEISEVIETHVHEPEIVSEETPVFEEELAFEDEPEEVDNGFIDEDYIALPDPDPVYKPQPVQAQVSEELGEPASAKEPRYPAPNYVSGEQAQPPIMPSPAPSAPVQPSAQPAPVKAPRYPAPNYVSGEQAPITPSSASVQSSVQAPVSASPVQEAAPVKAPRYPAPNYVSGEQAVNASPKPPVPPAFSDPTPAQKAAAASQAPSAPITPAPVQPATVSQPAQEAVSSQENAQETGIYSNRRPVGFTMFGRRIAVHDWQDMLVKICEILILKSPYVVAQFDKYQNLNPATQTFFSYTQSDIRDTGRKLSNGLWVEVRRSPDDIVMLCKKLLELCGYARGELEIEFAD